MAVRITPIINALDTLGHAEIEVHHDQETTPRGKIIDRLDVPHRARRKGRGAVPLHRLTHTLEPDETSTISMTTWVPDADRRSQRSIKQHAQITASSGDEVTSAIESWMNDVIAIETRTHDDQLLDEPDELDEVSPATNIPASIGQAPARTPVAFHDPFDLSTYPMPEQITRRIAVDDLVYVVHTPREQLDIPAGVRGLIISTSSNDAPSPDHVLVEMDSLAFAGTTRRWIDIDDLVFVDQPEAQVLAA